LQTPTQTILAISYFFHLIATVVWVGGLVTLGVLVWPEARRVLAENAQMDTLLTRLRKRFLPLSHFSLAVLIVTGLVQMTADPNYDGVLQFTNEWSRVILLKHIAIGGMFLSGLALQYGIAPALERASLLAERGRGDPDAYARLRRSEVRLTWLNIGLGVLVLGFSAWATAI
jgi:putative copper export protein